MDQVKVKKADLIVIMRENLAGHQAIFDEAVVGYQKAAEKILEKHLARVKKGSLARVYIDIPVPVNHTREYDRAIAMLGMSVEDEVTISQRDFASFAMDDWQWKREFIETNSAYSLTASRMSQSEN